MSRLLNDLLSYSRVNKKSNISEELSLLEFIEDIRQLVEKNEFFEILVPNVKVRLPRVPFQIIGVNLISNAIKHHHSRKGNIQIKVEKVRGGYEFEFIDDGPGIPAEYKDKVFDIFQTLKPRDEVEGSGMGLSLVKKLVEFYGGKIWLDTDYTDGCKMRIFWPEQDNLLINKDAI